MVQKIIIATIALTSINAWAMQTTINKKDGETQSSTTSLTTTAQSSSATSTPTSSPVISPKKSPGLKPSLSLELIPIALSLDMCQTLKQQQQNSCSQL